jgi:hypothetical protein
MNAMKFLALALLSALALPGLAHAGQFDGRMLGAWAQSEADCKETFVNRGGRWALKQPVNGLYVAFILQPHRVVATTGTCSVGAISQKGGYYMAPLTCNNNIGFLPVTARFKVLDGGMISYGSTDDPLMDNKYVRCR